MLLYKTLSYGLIIGSLLTIYYNEKYNPEQFYKNIQFAVFAVVTIWLNYLLLDNTERFR